jgi:hypothetical protein
MEEYYIEAGVHRAVAIRENGLHLIPAILYEPGQLPRSLSVSLDQLHTSRRTISRSDPRHNYSGLERAMGTILGRSRMPPIELQPLGLHGQPRTVPLSQVVIVA